MQKQTMLTIKQFADLMGVSTHQLRYFEEMGVLKPDSKSESNYRLFGIDAIYKTSHILFLRALGVSVDQIKTGFESFLPNEHEQCIQQAIVEMDRKIEELKATKRRAQEALGEYHECLAGIDKITVQNWDTKRLLPLLDDDSDNVNVTALELLKLKQIWGNHLHQMDLVYLHENGHTHAYLLMKNDAEPVGYSAKRLQGGSYITKTSLIQSEQDHDKVIEDVLTEAKQMDLRLTGTVVSIEKSIPSIFFNDHLLIQVAAQIADGA